MGDKVGSSYKTLLLIGSAFLFVIVGLSLWYLTWSFFFGAEFRYAATAGGILLTGVGTVLFIAFLGMVYLKVFLITGLVVGSLVAVKVFQAMWMWSGHMIEIGEATPITFIYWAVVFGMVYGLIAGFLGITFYHIFKTKIWRK